MKNVPTLYEQEQKQVVQSFEVRIGAVGNKGLVHKSSTSLLSINFHVRGFLLFRYYSNASVHMPQRKAQKSIQYVTIHFQDRRGADSQH